MFAASPTYVARTRTAERPTMWRGASACPGSPGSQPLDAPSSSCAPSRSSVPRACSAALASAHHPASPPGTAWITSYVTAEVVSASAQTTASVHPCTPASLVEFVSWSPGALTTRSAETRTPALVGRMVSSSVKMSVLVLSSVAETPGALHRTIALSAPVLTDSLAMQATRRLDARRSSASSMVTVSARASARTSSVSSHPSQV